MCKIGQFKKEDLEKCFHCKKPAENVYLVGDEIVDICADCLEAMNVEINDTSRNDQLIEDNPLEMPYMPHTI